MTSTASISIAPKVPVLVTGGTGRLGAILRHAGWDAPNIRWQSRHCAPGFAQFDPLEEADAFLQAARGKAALFCLSGVTPAGHRNTHTPFSANTALALAAIRAAAMAKCPRVFLCSTAAVYGAARGPLSEAGDAQPVSEYGWSKLEMEAAGLALGRDLGVAVTVLRIGNVAGADAILGGWSEGMEIDAQGEDHATPERSYIGPLTLARVLAQLSACPELPDRVNIAAPGTVSMGDLLNAAGLPWRPRRPAGDVIWHVELETELLRRYVDFAPEDSIPAGLISEWNKVRTHR